MMPKYMPNAAAASMKPKTQFLFISSLRGGSMEDRFAGLRTRLSLPAQLMFGS